ncbi:caseinolytic peptidase B protein [Dorcoceras hygrometricum]|uniref:Caseinolytic peptidase B protein n=1 Tax=Dorcoceras hygrometricum TaxID=472368 RepID=A0A2Z7CWB7_9LAMI|nr:caseinolytic peptidase B protein [Dorcoceras hygrometricum]
MSIFMCTSYYEVIPTLDDVRLEISNLVGLPEIKDQLETIVEIIVDAEKHESCGFTVIPPKPFHMVFVGNNGTGGGVLLVNIDEEDPINSNTLEDIMALMDESDTSVVFTGTYKALNQYMKFNNELYKRFSARLQFDDFTCEELAMIIQKKANAKGEDSLIDGFELDASCTTDNVAELIADITPTNLRSMLNAHLLDQMLIESKKIHLESGFAQKTGESIISLTDLALGIQNGAQIYMKLLNL